MKTTMHSLCIVEPYATVSVKLSTVVMGIKNGFPLHCFQST